MDDIKKLIDDELGKISPAVHFGQVCAVSGMMIEVEGLGKAVSIGDQCRILSQNRDDQKSFVPAEVVGFKSGRTLMMVFGKVEGIGLGSKVEAVGRPMAIRPSDRWLGRVINGLGEPIDGKGPLAKGRLEIPMRNSAPPAHLRQRIGSKLDLGVRAINAFLTMCAGQRMGIFAGSGVGKSILMSMLARYTETDISVIGLVGERGREVQEFIEDDLGEEGLKRSVVVVATSDQPPLLRRQAAYTTLAVSEYFRDRGRTVLCLMDSVTRFAMAQREIGLSAGEPPTSKGYPPTTFTQLARLLERAGPGEEGKGAITALFSVLVEGDDHNEPVSDAVRGILDGHIVLDRDIAQRGRYPAIDIQRSVSRAMPRCNTAAQNRLVTKARQVISVYEDMAELIRLGAYRKGSDPKVDEAIELYDRIETFLQQAPDEFSPLEESYALLAEALRESWPPEKESDQPDTVQAPQTATEGV